MLTAYPNNDAEPQASACAVARIPVIRIGSRTRIPSGTEGGTVWRSQAVEPEITKVRSLASKHTAPGIQPSCKTTGMPMAACPPVPTNDGRPTLREAPEQPFRPPSWGLTADGRCLICYDLPVKNEYW